MLVEALLPLLLPPVREAAVLAVLYLLGVWSVFATAGTGTSAAHFVFRHAPSSYATAQALEAHTALRPMLL
jgi:hypothetical protein